MKLHVIITTYNRPGMLRRVIRDIERLSDDDVLPEIHVYDDASDAKYHTSEAASGCTYTRMLAHHGRLHYWDLVNLAFQEAKYCDWDCLLMVPDDITLADKFFDKAFHYWNILNNLDGDLACLSFNSDQRILAPQWTNVEPFKLEAALGGIVMTQWMDMCFLCDRRMMEALDYSVQKIKVTWAGSSGVGAQLSKRLFVKGMTMYHTPEALVRHGGHESKMHPELRKETPLIH